MHLEKVSSRGLLQVRPDHLGQWLREMWVLLSGSFLSYINCALNLPIPQFPQLPSKDHGSAYSTILRIRSVNRQLAQCRRLSKCFESSLEVMHQATQQSTCKRWCSHGEHAPDDDRAWEPYEAQAWEWCAVWQAQLKGSLKERKKALAKTC